MSTTTPVQEHYDTSSVFVAVIGRPNVGKSSLTNLLVGEKVAIVTSKPQTTRTRITGVITRGPLQYVLLDTPGVHKAHNKLGKRMDKTASDSIADVDVSMMLFEPYGALNESEMALVEALHRSGTRVAIVSTKLGVTIRKIFARHGLEPLTDLIVGGEDVQRSKPDPEGLQLALGRLSLPARQVLFCGDTVIDAQTARSSGTDFCAVLNGTTGRAAFAPYSCVHIAPDLEDLRRFLSL